jgi:hypothetical protein
MRRPALLGLGQGPTGHVEHDDRGNAIWEWSDEIADAPLARISAFEFSDANDDTREVSLNTGRYVNINVKGGYNPYESGVVKKPSTSCKRDLRQLSKWIEERRQRGEPTKL